MSDVRPDCPVCGDLDLAVEIRMDGDAQCHGCGWSGPYKHCLPARDRGQHDAIARSQEAAMVFIELLDTKAKLAIAVEALERIARGTHEEHPTCMLNEKPENFGPPRTGGWEGWAREMREINIQLASKALAKIEGKL